MPEVSAREGKEQQLLFHINKSYQKSKCRYGSPIITGALQEQGLRISRPRVARLRQKTGIKSNISKQYRVPTTHANQGYPVAENHLNQDFSAERLAQKWVSDLTYINTGEGWLYLNSGAGLGRQQGCGLGAA